MTNLYNCKLSKKIVHSCTFSVQKENMNRLEAIGNSASYLVNITEIRINNFYDFMILSIS